jgi:hypothetical protein
MQIMPDSFLPLFRDQGFPKMRFTTLKELQNNKRESRLPTNLTSSHRDIHSCSMVEIAWKRVGRVKILDIVFRNMIGFMKRTEDNTTKKGIKGALGLVT